MLFSIEKYDFSAKRRQLALKKIYCTDTGFSSHLPIRFSPDRGYLLENLVAIELKRRYNDIFYWRNSKECDFLISQDAENAMSIQVCLRIHENNRQREFNGLKDGCEQLQISDGIILTYDQTETVQFGGITIHILPVYKWLIEN